MNNWIATLYNYWQLTRSSLLYLPILMCLGFIAVGIGIFLVDLHFKSFLAGRSFVYSGSVEGARDVFSLLLSAMITMTTLVISITMVVLSLSASQLGPRIVRVFMDDIRTKIYFGVFFGTIALCFTCIAILHDAQASEFVPGLTTSFVYVVCFFNLFVLLAYVNHVARSIGADSIITHLTAELLDSVGRLAHTSLRFKECRSDAVDRGFSTGSGYKQQELRCFASGYVQSIQYENLLKLAQEQDIFIQLNYKPGDFLVKEQVIGRVFYRKQDKSGDVPSFKELYSAILLGDYRSPTQDIEFSLRHMVEIALRALSPGMNDSFTAIAVLDKLAGVLAYLFTVSLPVYSLEDSNGQLRILAVSMDETDIIFRALSDIRQAGKGQRVILDNFIENIAKLMSVSTNASQRNALSLQLKEVRMHIRENFSDSAVGALLQEKLHCYELV